RSTALEASRGPARGTRRRRPRRGLAHGRDRRGGRRSKKRPKGGKRIFLGGSAGGAVNGRLVDGPGASLRVPQPGVEIAEAGDEGVPSRAFAGDIGRALGSRDERLGSQALPVREREVADIAEACGREVVRKTHTARLGRIAADRAADQPA